MGVKVAPYINGRIFDMGTDSWKANDGEAQKAAAKVSLKSVINKVPAKGWPVIMVPGHPEWLKPKQARSH